jgi:hypothetical protein
MLIVRFMMQTIYYKVTLLIIKIAQHASRKASDCESDDKVDDKERDQIRKWANHGFLKPLRTLMELSEFPVLTWMYKILVSLAITSSSAERAMSQVCLIRNRLRTTVLDDWFSALMILVSAKDILDKIPVDLITGHFAISSTKLQSIQIIV